MKQITILLVAIFFLSTVSAQENYKAGKSFTLQMDGFDFMAKGFSVWGAYTFNHNRVFGDGGRNELPDFLNPQSEDFYETRNYFVQAGYYRFLKKIDGLFVGIEFIYQQMGIEAIASNELQQSNVIRFAPVIGFEWAPFKTKAPKFTVTPWISERLPIYSKAISFTTTTKTYKTADYNFVMGINFGYRLFER